MGPRPGAQPALVYFPFDFRDQEAGRISWHAGGEGQDAPIWLLPGETGKEHFVGTDGQAYCLGQLPYAVGPA